MANYETDIDMAHRVVFDKNDSVLKLTDREPSADKEGDHSVGRVR